MYIYYIGHIFFTILLTAFYIGLILRLVKKTKKLIDKNRTKKRVIGFVKALLLVTVYSFIVYISLHLVFNPRTDAEINTMKDYPGEMPP